MYELNTNATVTPCNFDYNFFGNGWICCVEVELHLRTFCASGCGMPTEKDLKQEILCSDAASYLQPRAVNRQNDCKTDYVPAVHARTG